MATSRTKKTSHTEMERNRRLARDVLQVLSFAYPSHRNNVSTDTWATRLGELIPTFEYSDIVLATELWADEQGDRLNNVYAAFWRAMEDRSIFLNTGERLEEIEAREAQEAAYAEIEKRFRHLAAVFRKHEAKQTLSEDEKPLLDIKTAMEFVGGFPIYWECFGPYRGGGKAARIETYLDRELGRVTHYDWSDYEAEQ